MRKIDTYIIEKLKIDKDTKIDKHLSEENTEVLMQISAILNSVHGYPLYEAVKEWIRVNNIKKVTVYLSKNYLDLLERRRLQDKYKKDIFVLDKDLVELYDNIKKENKLKEILNNDFIRVYESDKYLVYETLTAKYIIIFEIDE